MLEVLNLLDSILSQIQSQIQSQMLEVFYTWISKGSITGLAPEVDPRLWILIDRSIFVN